MKESVRLLFGAGVANCGDIQVGVRGWVYYLLYSRLSITRMLLPKSLDRSDGDETFVGNEKRI